MKCKPLSALFLCCYPPLSVGAFSGISAFNTWLGGAILQSAGWAPTAISHLPMVAAAGIPVGSVLCCLGYAGRKMLRGQDQLPPDDSPNISRIYTDSEGNEHIIKSLRRANQYQKQKPSCIEDSCTAFVATSFLCNGVTSTAGAAMLGWSGPKLAFAGASGAVGGLVGTAGIGAVVGAIYCCGGIFCYIREEQTQKNYLVQMPPDILPDTTEITEQDIQRGISLNGKLTSHEMTDALLHYGLSTEANSFVDAIDELNGVKGQSLKVTDNVMK